MRASTLWLNFPPFDDVPDDTKWQLIREHRDKLLAQSDYSQLPDSPLSPAKREAWAEYRQVLRDIPQAYSSPGDAVFPDTP